MKKSSPLVSVLIPAHNAEHFIEESLNSILTQTFTDFEVVVVNDGSTDRTSSLVEMFANRDSRVRLFNIRNSGITKALNLGIDRITTPLIARHDADDIALPDRLLRQVQFLLQHPYIGAIGTQAEYIDSTGRKLGITNHPQSHAGILECLQYGSCFVHPSVMLRTDLVRSLGGYRPALECAEDYDLWVRMSERSELANLPDVLMQYRQHQGQLTANKIAQVYRAGMATRASAEFRKTNLPDPIDLASEIDDQLLERLGITQAKLQVEVANGLISQGHRNLEQKQFEAARLVARQAINALDSVKLLPRLRGRIYWNAAIVYRRAGSYRQACDLFIQSMLHSPFEPLLRIKRRLIAKKNSQ